MEKPRTEFFNEAWNAGGVIVVSIPKATCEAFKVSEGTKVRIMLEVWD